MFLSQQLDNKRFMALPSGKVTWDQLVVEIYNINLKRNKKFSGTFDDCIAKTPARGNHRFFDLDMPFGTLLMDGGLIRPDLNELAQKYSAINSCTVVWLQGFEPFYYQIPEISAWKNGDLIRRDASGVVEKYKGYVEKGYIQEDQFRGIADRHKTVGEPLPCEKTSDTLEMLALLGWNKDVLNMPKWRMAVTNFD